MAIRALPWRHSVRPGQGKCRIGVIKCRIRPDCRVVTEFARGWESCGGMGGIGRARVVLLVAGVAKSAVQRVVAIDVAVGAQPRRRGVRSGQWESCGGVIEFAVGPQHRVVAALARSREMCGDVVHGSRGRVVVVLVAADASRAGQVVVAIDVAIGARARRNRVRSRQREPGGIVIESRIQPRSCAVALLAGLREIRRYVVRVRRSLKILQVARYAGGARQVVIVVDVAIRACSRRNGMRSRQREASSVVIESRVQPRRCVVALLAGLRKVR